MRAENHLFLLWGSIDLLFVWVVETGVVFVCGPKITGFSVSIEIVLVFVKVGEIDWISVGKIELNLISVYG